MEVPVLLLEQNVKSDLRLTPSALLFSIHNDVTVLVPVWIVLL
jgi:hypothetical protein